MLAARISEFDPEQTFWPLNLPVRYRQNSQPALASDLTGAQGDGFGMAIGRSKFFEDLFGGS